MIPPTKNDWHDYNNLNGGISQRLLILIQCVAKYNASELMNLVVSRVEEFGNKDEKHYFKIFQFMITRVDLVKLDEIGQKLKSIYDLNNNSFDKRGEIENSKSQSLAEWELLSKSLQTDLVNAQDVVASWNPGSLRHMVGQAPMRILKLKEFWALRDLEGFFKYRTHLNAAIEKLLYEVDERILSTGDVEPIDMLKKLYASLKELNDKYLLYCNAEEEYKNINKKIEDGQVEEKKLENEMIKLLNEMPTSGLYAWFRLCPFLLETDNRQIAADQHK